MSQVSLVELTQWGIVFKDSQHKRISMCKQHRFHDFVMPFIHDNDTLMLKYKEIHDGSGTKMKEANEGHYDYLKLVKVSHTHTPFHCNGFGFKKSSHRSRVDHHVFSFH